jgi:hypothetical protein
MASNVYRRFTTHDTLLQRRPCAWADTMVLTYRLEIVKITDSLLLELVEETVAIEIDKEEEICHQ